MFLSIQQSCQMLCKLTFFFPTVLNINTNGTNYRNSCEHPQGFYAPCFFVPIKVTKL